jgi:hypothetical protein
MHLIAGGVTERDVVIVSGGQAALTLAFRALSTPGAPIVFEAPTYLGALAAASAARLVPVPVPCDAEGVLPDALERVLTATKARLIYCQPTYANFAAPMIGKVAGRVLHHAYADVAEFAGAPVRHATFALVLGRRDAAPIRGAKRDAIDFHVAIPRVIPTVTPAQSRRPQRHHFSFAKTDLELRDLRAEEPPTEDG